MHMYLDDAHCVEQSLDLAAEHLGDFAPAVYARFFDRYPQGKGHFRVVDPDQPPHGCGQMLFEIVSLLQDAAAGKPYVNGYMQQVIADHGHFGISGSSAYSEFLAALMDVVSRGAGAHWKAEHHAAWTRAIGRLLA